ncbi:MAG: hypothetical protein OXP66_07450 [Candidatus Tectomicrobia bacterium]|nr:hypothetical protein [Candidatus Tectomicrobia bacterium]
MIDSDELHRLVQAVEQQVDDLSLLDKLLALCLTVVQRTHIIVRNRIDTEKILNTPAASTTQITIRPGHFIALPSSRRRHKLVLPYMYWCAICNEIVLTRKSEQELERCTKCGSPRWRGTHVRDRRLAEWS